jgi:hypothetical protein
VFFADVCTERLLLAKWTQTGFNSVSAQGFNHVHDPMVIADLWLLQSALLLTTATGWTGVQDIDNGGIVNLHLAL